MTKSSSKNDMSCYCTSFAATGTFAPVMHILDTAVLAVSILIAVIPLGMVV